MNLSVEIMDYVIVINPIYLHYHDSTLVPRT